MLSILGSHCGEGAAPSPAPPPAFIYTPSIYASIPARHYLQTIHPSTHQTSKQPTNQATQTTQPRFSPNAVGTWFALRGRRCALPRTPSRLYLHSIHPSIHPLYHASNQQQANQATNPPKSFIFLPAHDPSITVCVFPKSKQPTSQAGRTNQHTNQRKWDKKERVATKLCFPQMLSILALHW